MEFAAVTQELPLVNLAQERIPFLVNRVQELLLDAPNEWKVTSNADGITVCQREISEKNIKSPLNLPLPSSRRIYYYKVDVPKSPEQVFQLLNGTSELLTWNKTMTRNELVTSVPVTFNSLAHSSSASSSSAESVNPNVEVTYTVTAPAAGGVISGRDFFYLRCYGPLLSCPVPLHPQLASHAANGFFLCACGLSDIDSKTTQKSLVRGAGGPSGYLLFDSSVDGKVSTTVLYLLDSDIKGWIPRSVVESALTNALHEIGVNLRAEALKVYA